MEIGSRRPDEVCVECVGTLGPSVGCVAHRVVHGGGRFTHSVVIDAGVEEEIARLSPLAPLHNPPALYGIFCWYQWWYGGGFGSRPLVDTLPLLALPIAVLAEKALDKHVQCLLGSLSAICIRAKCGRILSQQAAQVFGNFEA